MRGFLFLVMLLGASTGLLTANKPNTVADPLSTSDEHPRSVLALDPHRTVSRLVFDGGNSIVSIGAEYQLRLSRSLVAIASPYYRHIAYRGADPR